MNPAFSGHLCETLAMSAQATGGPSDTGSCKLGKDKNRTFRSLTAS